MKVYSYGVVAKTVGDDVRQQLKLAHNYYNTLIEHENARRRELWGGDKPPAPPHEKCKCSECKAALFGEPLDLKPLRAQATQEGLYFGSYLYAEESFQRALKSTEWYDMLSFRSWRSGGCCAVQIQKGSKLERWFQLEPAEDHRTGRRAGHKYTARLRIGSIGQKPLWSDPIHIVLHRPPAGRIVGVRLVLAPLHERKTSKRLYQETWKLQIVCRPEEAPKRPLRGVVAVDVGWRKLADGSVRLALARGDDGVLDELTLPPEWLELGERADRIRSARDRRLVRLQAKHPALSRLRNPARVADVMPELETWIKRERHLQQYEGGCRRRSAARRRNDVRVWAAKLRMKYRDLVVKDTKHKVLKERSNLPQAARRRGHHAAPGELIAVLREAFGVENTYLVKARDTTGACVACGHVNDHGPELEIVCEQCSDTRDRDHASTENMLALYWKGETGKPTARKTTPRFAKRHTKKNSSDNASSTA